MRDNQTIAAIATPIGRGGVGIIRISGQMASECSKHIIGHVPKPRYAEYVPFYDEKHQIIDHGIALFFPNPHSYTGEDVLELQAHGGPIVLDLLLKHVLQISNVRMADPGEFTERAFLNDKIDLTQAEAISDLIEANSEQAARSAINSLKGDFSKIINDFTEKLINLRTYIEASIDFPEDDGVDYLTEGKIVDKTIMLLNKLKEVQKAATNGATLRDGMKIVIAGRPNAGKSSLLNRLSGQERAIVTSIAGTTRDTIKEQIFIDGMPLHIIDTAGLRETSDEVECIGVQRTWQEINEADMVLLVLDLTTSYQENKSIYQEIKDKLPCKVPLCVVLNKHDLAQDSDETTFDQVDTIKISAKTGEGLTDLKEHLKKTMGYTSSTEGNFIARRRHLDALKEAQKHIEQALIQLKEQQAGELAAEELKYAQYQLNEITGKFSSDDLLTRIFSSFCLGK